VLKGERRSNMIPFFERLAEEGLWDASARWSSLDTQAESTVMHGFWIRPGHGTFVKMGKDIDGSEVKHWLRWDGLVSALDAQIERSKDVAWRDALRASRHRVTCPSCQGSGLGVASSLLELDGVPFDRWIRERSLALFLKAIESLIDTGQQGDAANRLQAVHANLGRRPEYRYLICLYDSKFRVRPDRDLLRDVVELVGEQPDLMEATALLAELYARTGDMSRADLFARLALESPSPSARARANEVLSARANDTAAVPSSHVQEIDRAAESPRRARSSRPDRAESPADRTELARALGRAARVARGCGPGPVDTQILVTYAPSGAVRFIHFAASPPPAAMQSCVLNAVARSRVPAFDGPALSVLKTMSW